MEKELSLIIGKNNCGKTSVLTALTKFLGEQSVTNYFNYDDFNIDLQKDLFECIEKDVEVWKERRCKGIELYIFIQYDETDNLANISSLMLDLDPDNKIVYKTVLFDKATEKICPDIFRVIDKRKIDLSKIISIKYIAAKREAMNKDNDETLSSLSSKYYESGRIKKICV